MCLRTQWMSNNKLYIIIYKQFVEQKEMVFYIIGLGLGDPEDISIKALQAIKSCKKVYLEYYTSVMSTNNKQLQTFLGVPIIEADRDFCEIQIDNVLEKTIAHDQENNYAFLVVGDAFCATTHSDLYLRAVKLGIEVKVIHNASIISAVGCTGLQVYRFGETVSVPLWNVKWKPDSFYDKIATNRKSNLHTLVLVDIKVKQRTEQNILKDKAIFEPPCFMTIKECVQQLLQIKKNKQQKAYDENTKCFGLARVGYSNQKILSGPMSIFLKAEMGAPLHSFVICAHQLHSVEKQMYDHFQKQE